MFHDDQHMVARRRRQSKRTLFLSGLHDQRVASSRLGDRLNDCVTVATTISERPHVLQLF